MLRAEGIVGEEVEKFTGWFRSRGAVPTIVALRQRCEAIRRAELQRLEYRLPADARDRVDEVTRLIVEKLLLTPTEQLKAAGDAETLAAFQEALTRLFALNQPFPASDDEREAAGRVKPFSRSSSGQGPGR